MNIRGWNAAEPAVPRTGEPESNSILFDTVAVNLAYRMVFVLKEGNAIR